VENDILWYNLFMIDPDLKVQLDQVNQNLIEIKNKKSGGLWRSFINGMFAAFGYIVGLALFLLVLGWFLQKTGLLKPYEDQVKNITNALNSAKQFMPPGQNPPATNVP
jgi:hypothetical protein